MSGYPGCRQTEETVVLRGLLWDNYIRQLERKLVEIILQEISMTTQLQ